MFDTTREDYDVELTLPDGRWILIFDVAYDGGERGNISGPPEMWCPEVPSSVEFEAVVGDSEDDSDIRRMATSDEIEAVYDDVLMWYEKTMRDYE